MIKSAERWVERISEGGEEFEALMMWCQCCNQPTIRSRVIRVMSEDCERWKWLDTYKTKGMGWLFLWAPLAMLLAIAVGSFAESLGAPLTFAALAFSATGCLLYLLPFFLIYGRRSRVVDAEKKEILKRYGEYNLEEVGLDEFYWKKYRILPMEES